MIHNSKNNNKQLSHKVIDIINLIKYYGQLSKLKCKCKDVKVCNISKLMQKGIVPKLVFRIDIFLLTQKEVESKQGFSNMC